MARKIVNPGARQAAIENLRRRLGGRPEIRCPYLHGSFLTEGPYRDIDVGALKGQPLVVRDRDWLDELRARTWDASTSARSSVREVNLDRLRDLAGHLQSAVRQLRELGQASQELFGQDARTLNSAKCLLIVATEAALDIGNHLAARRGGRSPDDYADCIAILAEIGAIDEQLKARLVRMARFCNLLVHLYARVDDAEVYRIIREDLGDFERYLASLAQYLKAELC